MHLGGIKYKSNTVTHSIVGPTVCGNESSLEIKHIGLGLIDNVLARQNRYMPCTIHNM